MGLVLLPSKCMVVGLRRELATAILTQPDQRVQNLDLYMSEGDSGLPIGVPGTHVTIHWHE